MAGRGFDDDDDVPLCFRRRPKKQRKTKHHHQRKKDQLLDVREADEQAPDMIGQMEASGDRSVSAALIDPEVFDCPICLENLSVPVFQCQNGHLACSSCCSKLGNQCPSCSSLGYYRCRGVENILESVRIPCRNMRYGCKEMVFCCERHDHEDKCPCTPCSCPLPDCDFVESSKNLYLHFSSKHSNSAISFDYDTCITIYLDKQRKYFVLQEKEEGTLFILNNWVELHGNLINLICIGESATIGFSYDLQVNNRGSSVILKSFTEFVPAWVEHSPLKRFLVVPSDFAGSCGMLTVELCIRR